MFVNLHLSNPINYFNLKFCCVKITENHTLHEYFAERSGMHCNAQQSNAKQSRA